MKTQARAEHARQMEQLKWSDYFEDPETEGQQY